MMEMMEEELRSEPPLDFILQSTEQQYLEIKRFDIRYKAVTEEDTKENFPQTTDHSVILVEEPAEEQKKLKSIQDKLTHLTVTKGHIPVSASVVSALLNNECKIQLMKKCELAILLADISVKTEHIIKHHVAEYHEKIMEIVIFTEHEGDLLPLSAMLTTRQFRFSLVPKFTRQILAGLSVLHENGIIHKDIRCNNILVQRSKKEGQMYILKIAHFEKASFGSPKSTTGEYDICPEGSSQFASPEMQQLTFDKDDPHSRIGAATDVYSLGCTVIEMIQRSPPRWIYYKDGQMMQYNFKSERTMTEFAINLHTLSFHQAEPDTSALGNQGNALEFVNACITRLADKRPSCRELQEYAFVTKSEI